MQHEGKISTKINNQVLFTTGLQLNIGSMEDYKKHKILFSYDKLCIVKIENADLLLSYLGEDYYFKHIEIALLEVQEYLKKKAINDILPTYILDNSTFILAGKPEVSKELFLNIVDKIHKNFHYIKSSKTDAAILVRFAVVTNQENLLKCALQALCAKENVNKHYMIYDNKKGNVASRKEEINMINVIHWAIENNGVIPYYQGIYDNKKHCIDRYEALMRLVDSDGVIHLPAAFMDVAKEYHMYAKLSEMMIRRVVEETDEQNMAVSINLSANDINSSEFRDFLMGILGHRKSNASLVFEILEDEVFEETLVLQEFVNVLEAYGIEIAIDDFGSGYSNLLEVAQISPHFIKIDGNIIKKINQSNKNKIILEAIVYLSQKINSLTIAEHIENEEIQRVIESLGIDFSQGYYFSKPAPMEALKK